MNVRTIMFSATLLVCFVFHTVFGEENYYFETKYADMPVDHFTFTNDYKFKLRYLENNTFWKPDQGGPIFFYAGNEGDIVNFCTNTGFMWEIAPKFKALLLFAEHRYYGESLPFGNESLSVKNAGYLTSSQALTDYVYLLRMIKNKYGLGQYNNPVIAFGGSYGGMLAAWFRMKYPATVAGSIAASAPIWQFTDMTPCNAFNNVISSVFKSASKECYISIKKSWKAITNISSTDQGKCWLSQNFKLCKSIEDENDINGLKSWLSAIYTNSAMVNYPYPTNFIQDLPANPVKTVCSHLSNSNKSDKDLLSDLFNAVSVYFNNTGSARCLDTQEESNDKLDDDGWNYQACTEMIMPMCDDGTGMFETSEWNVTLYSDSCFKKYGVRSHEYLVQQLYGGKDIRASSNIVFSNGLLDPWSSGGVLKSISKSLPVIIIPDGAHHLDLRSSNYADPISVIRARKFHKRHIKKWIRDYHREHGNFQYLKLLNM